MHVRTDIADAALFALQVWIDRGLERSSIENLRRSAGERPLEQMDVALIGRFGNAGTAGDIDEGAPPGISPARQVCRAARHPACQIAAPRARLRQLIGETGGTREMVVRRVHDEMHVGEYFEAVVAFLESEIRGAIQPVSLCRLFGRVSVPTECDAPSVGP